MTRTGFPIPISAFTGITAIGRGRKQLAKALMAGDCGLRPNDFEAATDVKAFIGRVTGVEDERLPESLAPWDCRNHRLAWMALHQDDFHAMVAATTARVGADRVGVFVGTSTSGILDTETMFRQQRTHELEPVRFELRHSMGSVSQFVAVVLGLHGPRHTVSTACSSSAKVFATAARYLSSGLCDAAVVGGVDSLCYTTLYGFGSLELLSVHPARPFAADRSGISIGEGAAFALLDPGTSGSALLFGVGESSDGHHMSTPHPEGLGAIQAMRVALDSAHLRVDEVDYVNLHGTGTHANDRAEAMAIAQLFGRSPVCSSTKGATGHCLGAAGAVEALLCDLALQNCVVPGNVGTNQSDPELPIQVTCATTPADMRYVLSNSFGFGGSNCSLVLGKATAGGAE